MRGVSESCSGEVSEVRGGDVIRLLVLPLCRAAASDSSQVLPVLHKASQQYL